MAYMMNGITLARFGPLAVDLDDGTDSGEARLTSGTLCHRDLSSIMGSGEYTSIASAWDAEFDSVLTSSGATVSFNATTLRYTITLFGGATTLDFRTATIADGAGIEAAKVLGFDYNHADASGGSSSDPFNIQLTGQSAYTSNVTPHWILELDRDHVANYEPPYEIGGQVQRVVSSNGNAYSVAPTNLVSNTSWEVWFQTEAKTYQDKAVDGAFTYEDLIKTARAWEPIVLNTTDLDMVTLNIVGEFTKEARRSHFDSYHGYWKLSYEGQFLGRLS